MSRQAPLRGTEPAPPQAIDRCACGHRYELHRNIVAMVADCVSIENVAAKAGVS